MPNLLVTNKFKLHISRQIAESITEPANTSYYMFLGHHIPRANTSDLTLDVSDSGQMTDVYRNMVCGKRVSSGDLAEMVRYVPYVANAVYSMYDDIDSDLSDKDFYVIVDEDSYLHLYKCLDNNNSAYSTVQPTYSDIAGSNSIVYQTSDGYRWKYLASTDRVSKLKFATSDYFPIYANSSVSNSAIPGSVEIVKVEDGGSSYNNYLTGTLQTGNIKVTGIPELYGISNSASQTNGFYTGCMFYLSSGTGTGQYKEIVESFSTVDGNFITLEGEFDTTPENGTTFQIYPAVKVTGDGMQTVNAVGRALINASASNSVYRVEMFAVGQGYQHANASVSSNAVVGATSANIRAIISPPGGHGYDVMAELDSTRLCFAVKFSNSESNTIVTASNIKQVGLIRDPKFANVYFSISGLTGNFLVGEPIYRVNPIRLDSNATLSTTSNSLYSDTSDFINQIAAGDVLHLKSSNGAAAMLATVDSVVNASHITLTTNGLFSCTSTVVSQSNLTSTGIVTLVPNSTYVVCSNVVGVFPSNSVIIGSRSGAFGVVNTTYRNDVNKGFDTFVQLNKYVGASVSGTFTENEIVYQESLSVSNAYVHSTSNSGGVLTLYTTNQLGPFIPSIGFNLLGNTSGAEMTLANNFSPELIFGSGEVLYIENIDEVSMANTLQSQTFRLIFEF